MFNGFAIALASEGHLRYFKAQKASEGNRFHKPDSQYHTEKHQKPTNLTKMLDFLTSQYPQNLILSIILRSSKKQQIPNAYSSGTQVEGCSPLTANIAYIVFQCLLFWKKANISLSVTLNALNVANASYVKVKAKDDTPQISFHPRLYWKKQASQLTVHQCWRGITLTETKIVLSVTLNALHFSSD